MDGNVVTSLTVDRPLPLGQVVSLGANLRVTSLTLLDPALFPGTQLAHCNRIWKWPEPLTYIIS